MSSNTHLVITSCPSSLLYIILPFPLFHTPFFTSIPHLKHKNTSPTYPHCALLLLLLSVHVRPSCLTSIQSPSCWPAPRPSLLTICFFLRPVTFSLPSSSSQNLMPIPLSRWDGGAGVPLADRDLPPWEEWGDVQPAGCGQHGWRFLHARCCHGSFTHYLHLWTLVLLAAALLLHGRLLRPARLRLLNQQGEKGWGKVGYYSKKRLFVNTLTLAIQIR